MPACNLPAFFMGKARLAFKLLLFLTSPRKQVCLSERRKSRRGGGHFYMAKPPPVRV